MAPSNLASGQGAKCPLSSPSAGCTLQSALQEIVLNSARDRRPSSCRFSPSVCLYPVSKTGVTKNAAETQSLPHGSFPIYIRHEPRAPNRLFSMQSFAVLSVLFCAASAQLAAWPASSYSPYYQALLGAARTPVASVPYSNTAPSAIPAAAPVAPVFAAPAVPVAAAPIAPALPVAPAFAAPVAAPVFPAPAFAPMVAPVRPAFAPAPVLAAPVAPVAPMVAAPAVPLIPRVVPAYAPFATSAMFIGSNKAKTA